MNTADSPEVRKLRQTDLERHIEENGLLWENAHVVLKYCNECDACRYHMIRKTDAFREANDSSVIIVEYDSLCLGINKKEKSTRDCKNFQSGAQIRERHFNALLQNFKKEF